MRKRILTEDDYSNLTTTQALEEYKFEQANLIDRMQREMGEKINIVRQSTEPDDKDVLWIKDDNLKPVFKKVKDENVSALVIYYYLKNDNVYVEIPSVQIEQVSGEILKVDYLKWKNFYYSLKNIKLESPDKLIILLDDDYSIERIKKDIGVADIYEDRAIMYDYANDLSFLKKIGEEYYSTLNIYNKSERKWQKVNDKDIKIL